MTIGGPEYGLDYRAMTDGADAWERLEPLMDDSAADLRTASIAGLAPSVRAAATTFLDTWAGYAEQSADIARGMGEALRATSTDTFAIDTETAALYDRLDTQLDTGGARP